MPTHTRIRMFNTKDTYPNQSLDNDLCQAVRAGNTVYVRGQVGTDFEGRLVGLGDARAQTEQAMKNVKQLLEEAGSDLSHIVKTTTYLIDPRYREAVYQEVGLSRSESAELVDSILAEIGDSLVADGTVKISSFGTFSVRQKGQRIGRNPKTGQEVPILPRRVLVFRASQVLKDRINLQDTGARPAEDD